MMIELLDFISFQIQYTILFYIMLYHIIYYYSDDPQKPIEIKSGGFPVEKVNSEFICRKEADPETNLDMDALTLPGDMVEDSCVYAWITVTGDIMAQTLFNLEKLLKLPCGCGEQVSRVNIFFENCSSLS